MTEFPAPHGFTRHPRLGAGRANTDAWYFDWFTAPVPFVVQAPGSTGASFPLPRTAYEALPGISGYSPAIARFHRGVRLAHSGLESSGKDRANRQLTEGGIIRLCEQLDGTPP